MERASVALLRTHVHTIFVLIFNNMLDQLVCSRCKSVNHSESVVALGFIHVDLRATERTAITLSLCVVEEGIVFRRHNFAHALKVLIPKSISFNTKLKSLAVC